MGGSNEMALVAEPCLGHGVVAGGGCRCDPGWSSWSDIIYVEGNSDCNYPNALNTVALTIFLLMEIASVVLVIRGLYTRYQMARVECDIARKAGTKNRSTIEVLRALWQGHHSVGHVSFRYLMAYWAIEAPTSLLYHRWDAYHIMRIR